MRSYSQTLGAALRLWAKYVITPCAFGLLGLSMVLSVANNLNFPWTSLRLAPSFALVRGYPLYSLPDHPPWVMVGYGPFYPIAYLPSIFAKDPVTAVSIATFLAYAYILVPVGLLAALFCRRLDLSAQPAKVSWVPIFLFFGLLTSFVPSLSYVTTAVHVDAPALGLFLMACYGVLRAQVVSQRWSGRLIVLAGISAGLSMSCKITLLASTFGLILFILRSFNWKRAAWFALSAVLTTCLIYGWIIVRDGFPAVFLNFQVLGKFPLSKYLLLSLFRFYLMDYGVVILATLALIRLPSREVAHSKTLPATQMVWLFLFIALLVMPVSIASVAKYGGDVNSRAIFTLPLTLAAIFTMWDRAHRANLIGSLTTGAALTGAVLIVAPHMATELKRLNLGRSLMEESYATVKAYPSQCYFPYDPLAHLLAGDRFRPNMDVIYSYAIAGFPVNQAAFASSMPEEMKYVIYPSSIKFWGLNEIRRLLPAQSVPTKSLNLALQEVWGRGITKSDSEAEMTKESSGL